MKQIEKQIIFTNSAPQAVGPYSQAVKAGNLLCVSGQLPIDPSSGRFPSDDIEQQTRQCLINLDNILKAAGTGLENVIKVTVFLKDLGHFDAMNKIYAQYFTAEHPTRCCVQVAKLPLDANIEIEAMAITSP